MTVPFQLGHVAVPAKNPGELAGFYQRLLGLEVSLTGAVPGLGDFVFLADRQDAELPLLALHTLPEGRHFALQVESLDALRTFWAGAAARGFTPSMALDHRVSISVYFHDPEGNMVEVYWPTGSKDVGSYADPITLQDLGRREQELLRHPQGRAQSKAT